MSVLSPTSPRLRTLVGAVGSAITGQTRGFSEGALQFNNAPVSF
jgi:hypothetical protein